MRTEIATEIIVEMKIISMIIEGMKIEIIVITILMRNEMRMEND